MPWQTMPPSPRGLGVYTWKNGNSYTGNVKGSRFDSGGGTVFFADGTTRKVDYTDEKMSEVVPASPGCTSVSIFEERWKQDWFKRGNEWVWRKPDSVEEAPLIEL